MRKLLVALFLLTVSANVFAFRVNAFVRFNGNQAQAIVQNQWARPIMCSGYLRALDASGRWIDEWLRNVIIMPGQQVYLNAFAYGYGNYMRDAGANINCVWR